MAVLFIPSAGQRLTAAQVQQMLPIRVTKPADVARASTIVLAADSALVLPLPASAEHDVLFHVIYTAGATGLFSIGFTGPAGATFDWTPTGLSNTVSASDSGDATFLSRAIGDTKNLGASGTGTPVVVRITGRCITSTTAGNLTLLWAQTVSNGTGTTVKANSYAIAKQVF